MTFRPTSRSLKKIIQVLSENPLFSTASNIAPVAKKRAVFKVSG